VMPPPRRTGFIRSIGDEDDAGETKRERERDSDRER